MAITKKIVLSGHFGVGKTSLVQKFVENKFSEAYQTTIGVKVDKKVLTVDGVEVSLIIWDIAGESSMVKIPKNYLLGTHGVIYVFDVSRPETYVNLEKDLFQLKSSMMDTPYVILGNKMDIVNQEFLQEVKGKVLPDVLFTSAKTGDNVELAFENLTRSML